MVPTGSTRPRLVDIWPQLAVSACVLLAPPLLMAAALTLFDSSPPQGVAAPATVAGADNGNKPTSFGPPDDGRGANFATASIEPQPVIAAARPLVEAPAKVDPPPVLRPAEPAADTSAPERSPDATRKVARNEPHNGHGTRRPRTLTDIFPFLRPR
jgi:hypothetical protein